MRKFSGEKQAPLSAQLCRWPGTSPPRLVPSSALCAVPPLYPPAPGSYAPVGLCPAPRPTALRNVFDIPIDPHTRSDRAGTSGTEAGARQKSQRGAGGFSPSLPASPANITPRPSGSDTVCLPPLSFLSKGEESPVGRAETPKPLVSSDVQHVPMAWEGGEGASRRGAPASLLGRRQQACSLVSAFIWRGARATSLIGFLCGAAGATSSPGRGRRRRAWTGSTWHCLQGRSWVCDGFPARQRRRRVAAASCDTTGSPRCLRLT